MYRSSVQSVGQDEPDYVYYNADIINNTTADQIGGRAVSDPQIRFNETRDTALIKNASDYYFSIIRFTMNGANKDLPLFIPDIQENTGQDNVNLTSYSIGISYEQVWRIEDPANPGNYIDYTFRIVPRPRYVIYRPETKNPDTAPTPRTTANPNYKGLYNAGTTYKVGDIVALALEPAPYNNGIEPFYEVLRPAEWSPAAAYAIGNTVMYANVLYRAIAIPPIGVPPSVGPFWVEGITGIAPPNPIYWSITSPTEGRAQDLGGGISRYYWVYTYSHWLRLVNETLDDCYLDIRDQFALAWAATGTPSPFPFAGAVGLANFKAICQPPQIIYDQTNNLFTIYSDSDGYGERLEPFFPVVPPPAVPLTAYQEAAPKFRLFFNANLFGLFSNFENTYYNTRTQATNPWNGLPIWVSPTENGPGTLTPVGYTNEIVNTNRNYSNVVDYRLAPYSGVPPLGYVPLAKQKVYWVNTQDYSSTGSLWSPIASIVFTSTLLPIKNEATGQPVDLGEGNTGFSAPVSQSAFEPIITDIALDTAAGGAADYRKFIFYAPVAEYRLSDFTSSKQDIRNIDIQVYWKNRLDNQLYPITMFNLSSVSVKIMFRRKTADSAAKSMTQVAFM